MPWTYVELHPKIHSAASPEYGDTTCGTFWEPSRVWGPRKPITTFKISKDINF